MPQATSRNRNPGGMGQRRPRLRIPYGRCSVIGSIARVAFRISPLHLAIVPHRGEYIMEFAELIVQLISNNLVPVACLFIVLKMWRDDSIANQEKNERFITAIENNTAVMENVLYIIEKGEKQ